MTNVSQLKSKFEDDVDALYRLPLAEFTAARNELTKRLKQSGRGNEADFVKALVKPSISAWAVNQLYWKHRKAFDQLVATGQRFSQAQTSGHVRKVADMRGALDARREALLHVSELATGVLRDAGHNPTPDTVHRINTTLEAMSVYASIPDGPRPGRLTNDVDPPGFDSLASLIPSAGLTARTKEPARVEPLRKVESAAEVRKLEATRQASIAAAKASLQQAKSLLSEARAKVQSLEAAQKKASAEAKDAEKRRREAEERFEKAKGASEEANRHAQRVGADAQQTAHVVEDAKHTVEKATRELEKLFRESPR